MSTSQRYSGRLIALVISSTPLAIGARTAGPGNDLASCPSTLANNGERGWEISRTFRSSMEVAAHGLETARVSKKVRAVVGRKL